MNLAEVKFGDETYFKPPLNQVVGGLLGLEGGLGQSQVVLVRGNGQDRIGDLGYQQDLYAAAGLFRGKVFLQGPPFQAANTVKEVDLLGTDGQIGAILFHSHRRSSPEILPRTRSLTYRIVSRRSPRHLFARVRASDGFLP